MQPDESVDAGQTTDTDTSPADDQGAQTAESETTPKESESLLADGLSDEGSESEESDGGDAEPDGEEAPEVPETYEFKMPEGMQMDETLAASATPIFKEIGLTQEQADKVIGMYAQHIQHLDAEIAKSREEQQERWKSDLKKDADFGGENFDVNQKKVMNFVKATVPEHLRKDIMEFFVTTGAGNHPALVKYFHHMSNVFNTSEDQPGGGAPGVTRKAGLEGAAERLYGQKSN